MQFPITPQFSGRDFEVGWKSNYVEKILQKECYEAFEIVLLDPGIYIN